VTKLTLVSKTSNAPQHPGAGTLLIRFLERVLQLPWPGEARVEPAVARALEEAFESLAREARS
jgi:hypothetical protein